MTMGIKKEKRKKQLSNPFELPAQSVWIKIQGLLRFCVNEFSIAKQKHVCVTV